MSPLGFVYVVAAVDDLHSKGETRPSLSKSEMLQQVFSALAVGGTDIWGHFSVVGAVPGPKRWMSSVPVPQALAVSSTQPALPPNL